MEQKPFNIELEPKQLMLVDKICKKLGKNINSVFNAFATALITEGKVPENIAIYYKDQNQDFKNAIKELREESAHLNITLDEIDEEISKYRAGI